MAALQLERLEQLDRFGHAHVRQPSSAAAGSSVFGTAKKRDRYPVCFGMINDETGAVTFPEARQGAIAAANYVNSYLGGINGHPIVIDNCTGDRLRLPPPHGAPTSSLPLAPDGHPRRGRRRRARLDPDLPARQPGLPGGIRSPRSP